MITANQTMWILVAGMVGVVGISAVSAELPALTEKQWLGHFVGFQNKKFQYGFTVQGKSLIKVMGKKDVPVTAKLAVQVEFLVEEVLPDGKTYVRAILPETLESTQPATQSPKNIVIRGKVKGDASFEVFIHEDRGAISLGGRLLDPGSLTKNPTRFSIRVKFPDAYPYATKVGDKKQEKAFEEKIKNDRLQLTWTDGKRFKQDTDKDVDAGSKEINGPGIRALQVEFSSYDEKKFEVTASENSVMTLTSGQTAPLYEGFTLTWMPDAAKDPEGKARLGIEIK